MSTHVEWYQAWHWKHCFLSSGSLQTQLISTDSFVRHMWYGTPWCFWEWNHSPRFQTADVVLMHSTLVISLICWIQSMTQINGICQWRQTTITAPHLLLYLFIGQSDCTPWIYNVMPAYCVWTWFVKHAVKDIDCFRIEGCWYCIYANPVRSVVQNLYKGWLCKNDKWASHWRISNAVYTWKVSLEQDLTSSNLLRMQL